MAPLHNKPVVHELQAYVYQLSMQSFTADFPAQRINRIAPYYMP